MNYFHGLLFAPLALISPNSALPLFLVWLTIYSWVSLQSGKPSKKFEFIFQAIPYDILRILALFLGWACISSFWSLSPHDSIIVSLKLVGFVFLGLSWISSCSQQTKAEAFLFLKGLTIGCSGVAIFMLTDYALGGKFVHFREVSSIKTYYAASHVLVLCFYPICFWICKQVNFLSCFLFALLTVTALYRLDIDITLVALTLGALVQGLAFLFSRTVFKFLWQTGFVLLMVVFPFFCAFILSPNLIQTFNHAIPIFSYVHRLHIWHFLSEKVFLHPWIGHGLDTSHLQIIRPSFYTWTFFEKTTHIPLTVQHTLPHNPLFLHAHNAVIQLWFELGFIGICLVSLFLLKVFARIHTGAPLQRISTFGYTTTAITIVFASLDFWHSWWLATLWISSGIVILTNRVLAQEKER